MLRDSNYFSIMLLSIRKLVQTLREREGESKNVIEVRVWIYLFIPGEQENTHRDTFV